MKSSLLMVLAFSSLSFTTQAEVPSFNFFEVGATEQESDIVDGDFSGFEVAASYELKDNFFLSGKHITTKDDATDLELTTTTVGLGYRYGLGDSTILFMHLDFAGVVFERENSGSFDEQGHQFGIGVKSQITDAFEVEASLRYVDAGEVDETFGLYNKTYALIGVNFMVANSVSLYADYEAEEEGNRAAFGVRYDY